MRRVDNIAADASKMVSALRKQHAELKTDNNGGDTLGSGSLGKQLLRRHNTR